MAKKKSPKKGCADVGNLESFVPKNAAVGGGSKEAFGLLTNLLPKVACHQR